MGRIERICRTIGSLRTKLEKQRENLRKAMRKASLKCQKCGEKSRASEWRLIEFYQAYTNVPEEKEKWELICPKCKKGVLVKDHPQKDLIGRLLYFAGEEAFSRK